MRTILEQMKEIIVLGENLSLKSAVKEDQLGDLNTLADLLVANFNYELQ